MNTKTKSNLIASIILAIVPFGPLALLLPAGEVVASVIVIAALLGLGAMELKQGAYARLPKPAAKDAIELFREIKAEN